MIAATLIAAFFSAGCGRNAQQGPQNAGAEYASMTIAPVSVSLSESYPASIEGRQDIAIFPQVSGTVSKVCVKEGQRVRKGQSLFVIDQVPFKAALQMAQANVEAAQAGVTTAQQSLLQAETAQAQDTYEKISAIITLYRALGGGVR